MADQKRLHRNVKFMGLTSLFTDISSEMVYPLLQAFVSMVLASHQAILGPVLGLIEGVAESTASLLKVVVGYYSDKIQRRKAPVIVGYGASALAKLLLFLTTFGWYFVLLARFFDRIGKGIRTAPRDALIAESTPPEIQGRAYGFHRAMDFTGATIGVLLCYFISLPLIDPLTKTLKNLSSFYLIFAISIVPALIGVAFLFRVKEVGPPQSSGKVKPRPNLNFRAYDRNLQVFFLAQFVFTLGNSSNQFLLLRSSSLGYSLSTVILMYMLFNLATSFFATFFGSLSDRIGRKKVLIAGYLLYSLVYIAFGFLTEQSKHLLWVFWIVYGLYYAMTDGVEKAYVAGMAPSDSKATAMGFYHTIVGIGLLPASIIAGLLFSLHPAAPFIFGGLLSITATCLLAFRGTVT